MSRRSNLQRSRALAIMEGDKLAKKARYFKVTDEEKAFDLRFTDEIRFTQKIL